MKPGQKVPHLRKAAGSLLTWLLAIVMLAIAPAGASMAAEESDPIVVRVGAFSYPLSMVQESLSSVLDLAALYSDTSLTDEDRQAGIAAAIEKFVNIGLIECKLSERGQNSFTEEETELLKSAAQQKYEELWQALYRQARQSDENVTEEDITGWLEGEGYTIEAIYDEYVVSERNHRAITLFCPDIVLTQEQVEAYYEEQFVAPDRERYQDNIELFEQEIVSGSGESFYIPEGYRYIRQITLDYPKEAVSAAKALEKRMSRATTELAQSFQKLAVAATTAESWEEIAPLRAAYDQANENALNCRDAWLARLKALAQPLLQETINTITEGYQAGIPFLDLIKTWSTDKTDQNLSGNGYLFHPDSSTWPDAFRDAAAKLKTPGDISSPVFSETGVHILFFTGEAPAGDHVLTAEEQEQLNASALTYYQNLKLSELCETWRGEYEIETHPELLTAD